MKTEILSLSWEYIEGACLNIAHKIKQEEFKPDLILPVLWGGAIPARILIDMMNWPRTKCRPIVARSYYSSKRNKDVSVDIDFDIDNPETQNVLIVEEIIDTGNTYSATILKLVEKGFCSGKIYLASIAFREFGKIVPDFYHVKVKNEWIVFPWDKREYIREIETK